MKIKLEINVKAATRSITTTKEKKIKKIKKKGRKN